MQFNRKGVLALPKNQCFLTTEIVKPIRINQLFPICKANEIERWPYFIPLRGLLAAQIMEFLVCGFAMVGLSGFGLIQGAVMPLKCREFIVITSHGTGNTPVVGAGGMTK